ncbi:hypothetical protein MASR2M117_02860 [Paludibacter sp.]
MAQAPNWGEADTLASHKLGPGIKYSKIYFKGKKMLIWVTEVDLTNPYNKIEQVQSNHKVPDLVRWTVQKHYSENSRPGHKVCVAFNHDFFSYEGGICIGLNISNGEIPYGSGWGRSLLAFNDQKKAAVFRPNLDASVILPDNSSVCIDCFNSAAEGISGNCILFNRFNARTLTEAGKYIQIIPKGEWTVNGDPVPCEVAAVSSTPIQSSGSAYVIFLRGAKLNSMDGVKAGDTIYISQKLNTSSFGSPISRVLNAFHGYPSIAFNGKLHDGEYNNFENGREYEISSRLMAGISKDGNTLYIVNTEMSSTSAGVNCIDLANYMLSTGSWDVVNFDSGGSVAIVVDAVMLNYPARDAVRPVMDAMLAVSTAPESNEIASYSFLTPSIRPSATSAVQLNLMGFNMYDEVISKDVKGFKFTCIPETLGTIDENQVLHLGIQAVNGTVIAEKDGLRTSLKVFTRPVEDISINPDKILIDKRSYPIRIETKLNNTVYAISPNALTWSVENPNICSVENGLITGKSNGETTVSGTFGSIKKNLQAKVEIGKGVQTVENFSTLSDFTVKSSGVKNLNLISNPQSDEVDMQFDFTAGRASYIDLAKEHVLYGLPDSLSWNYFNHDNIVKEFIFTFEDVTGKSMTVKSSEQSTGNQRIVIPFANEGLNWDVSLFPIKFKKVKINLNAKDVKQYTLKLGNLKAHYRESDDSGVLQLRKTDDVQLRMEGKDLIVDLTSSDSNYSACQIYSTHGQLLKSFNNLNIDNNKTIRLDIGNLSKGVYVIRFMDGNKSISKKLLINNAH